LSTTKLESSWDLRKKILDGVNTLGGYVAATLGPKGQNVLIHLKDRNPFVTKDGVTVAQNISFDDPFVNAGAEVVKQASAQTNAEAGDGTTTSTVLAMELLNGAHKHISSGVSPIEMKRGLDRCLESALQIIEDISKPISSEADVRHIAEISANNDPVIGNLVATAVERVGKNGTVTIEEARSLDTTLELVEGFKIDSGYVATAFITDDRRSIVRYENPMFLVTDSKIEFVQDILPALEVAAREARPFVIVADDVDGQALAALIVNTVRGSMRVAAVKAPRYGEERSNILSDFALSVGARYFRQIAGDKITDVALSDFGSAKTVEITKHATTVVDGAGAEGEVSERIEKIRNEISECDDIALATRLQERITRLASGIAIIKVGASTQVEMIEKKHRIEDALEAVRSAQQEGVIPGGGTTLLRVASRLVVDFNNEEQATSLTVFKRALESPFRRMALNSGLNPDIVTMQMESEIGSFGINFLSGERVDLVAAGVIDPAKVTRCALKNAVSVAGALLLTNHSIVQV